MAIKGYWRMNGNSNDASGNGNNGADTAITYSQANGVLNMGAGFDGSISHINISDNGSLDMNASIGISFMIYVKTAVAYGVVVVKGYDGATHRVNYNVDLGANGLTLRFVYSASDQNFCYWIATSSLTLNKWQHVSITHTWQNTSSTKVLIDSKLISGSWTNGSFSAVLNNDVIRFGARLLQTDRLLNSNLDEFRIRDNYVPVSATKNEYAVIKGFF